MVAASCTTRFACRRCWMRKGNRAGPGICDVLRLLPRIEARPWGRIVYGGTVHGKASQSDSRAEMPPTGDDYAPTS